MTWFLSITFPSGQVQDLGRPPPHFWGTSTGFSPAFTSCTVTNSNFVPSSHVQYFGSCFPQLGISYLSMAEKTTLSGLNLFPETMNINVVLFQQTRQ